jgi:pimeloyl-ACP methyl ester carboxylesterase
MAIPLAYEGRGLSGPPVLLIHGFPLDRSMWRGQIDGLGSIARVVALDLPGFGATAPASDGHRPTTMDEYADCVVALADALGFTRFVAAGLSMGGYVALELVRRHPHRLSGLILADTRAEPDPPEGQKGRHHDADRVLNEGLSFLVERMVKGLLAPETVARRRDIVNGVEAMIHRSSWHGVAAALRGMAARRDARQWITRIDVPTLVVVGAEDAITPPRGAQAMAQAIPNAELAVIPGAGHLAPLESPDAVNTAFRKLLRRAALDPKADTKIYDPLRR